MKKILVVGGSNIDYIGKSIGPLKAKDSNIGSITVSFGGVARNICESLARLNLNVKFITAVGNDLLAKALVSQLEDLKVEVIKPTNTLYSSGGYLAIHDEKGDMSLALCDQEIIKLITVDYLKSLNNYFLEADIIVTDANLSQDSLEYIVNVYQNKMIVLDAISSSKVRKLENVINKVYLLKCNLLEARELVGAKLEPYELANKLLQKGCKNLIITNADKEIVYLEDKNIKTSCITKIDEKDICNTTGVGDALISGIVFGLSNDLSLTDSLYYGKKAASITLLSEKATSEDIIKIKE